MPLCSHMQLPNSNENSNEFSYWKSPRAELHSPISVQTYRISRELLRMEVLCGEFMRCLLPGQQLPLFPFKAVALFEACFSCTLEAVTVLKEKKASGLWENIKKNLKTITSIAFLFFKISSHQTLRFIFPPNIFIVYRLGKFLQSLYIQLLSSPLLNSIVNVSWQFWEDFEPFLKLHDIRS